MKTNTKKQSIALLIGILIAAPSYGFLVINKDKKNHQLMLDDNAAECCMECKTGTTVSLASHKDQDIGMKFPGCIKLLGSSSSFFIKDPILPECEIVISNNALVPNDACMK